MAQARRYNTGKLKYGLIPNTALKEIAKVYTLGAHKYTIYGDANGNEILGKDISLEEASKYEVLDSGDNNWRKGQSWTGVMESVKRHIQAWEDGEDYDELTTLHLANASFGLNQLLDYYSTHPELDDRQNAYFDKRVALDVDGVICNFEKAFCERMGIESRNNHWHFTYLWKKHRDEIANDRDFWLNMEPLIQGNELPFEPVAYVTNRGIPVEWTMEWLELNNFPCEPVYRSKDSKVDVLKNIGVDLFVEDSYRNFVDLNNNGVFCYLLDRPYNQKFDVGHRRIHHLNEIVKR